MQMEDELYFVERLVPNGPDDCEWQMENSFYSFAAAKVFSATFHDKGETMRVIKGNKTVLELVGV